MFMIFLFILELNKESERDREINTELKQIKC